MNAQCTAIFGVLLFAAACTQTPIQSPIARVVGPQPAVVRATAGSVWVGKTIASEPRPAWALPAQGDVENLDVMPIGSSGGFAVTFRQGGSRWEGYLDPKLQAMGELERVSDTATGATQAVASDTPRD